MYLISILSILKLCINVCQLAINIVLSDNFLYFFKHLTEKHLHTKVLNKKHKVMLEFQSQCAFYTYCINTGC